MPPKRRKNVFAALLDDEDFAFVTSPDDELASTESDVCSSCGSLRKFHEVGVEGSVLDSEKCRRFKEMR